MMRTAQVLLKVVCTFVRYLYVTMNNHRYWQKFVSQAYNNLYCSGSCVYCIIVLMQTLFGLTSPVIAAFWQINAVPSLTGLSAILFDVWHYFILLQTDNCQCSYNVYVNCTCNVTTSMRIHNICMYVHVRFCCGAPNKD